MIQRQTRRTRFLRRIRWFFGVMLVLLISWITGFLVFAQLIPDTVMAPTIKTEAIVVLTGGTLRLETGIELLTKKQAKKLFVSGVHRGVDVRQLLRVSQRSPEAVECCISLGYDADDTQGNALETANWLNQQNYKSLRLVTASYHMPRSLLEFRAIMRGIKIIPHPVFPKSFKAKEWWLWPGSAGLILDEYNKYLFSIFRRPFLDLVSQ
jgi:uncharacterized SAM-binding protein YcdF (DUF218 family)